MLRQDRADRRAQPHHNKSTSSAVLRVKICGITTLADAQLVVEAGGDAIGFNFYPRSTRYVEPEAARAVVRGLSPAILKVGVFVNESSGTISEVCRQVGLDCVQLHGDEPASVVAELPASVAVIRAFRLEAGEIMAAVEHLSECARHGRTPDAVLVDAYTQGAYGGTGRTINWRELAAQKALFGGVRLILAGGLTAQNVKAAIDAVRPWGVDTASGVELSPGVKDHAQVRRFIAEAQSGLGQNAE